MSATPIKAATTPKPMQFDSRVREVVYNGNDVVRIRGAYGFSTQITFAPDEVIVHTALGDSLAWEIAPVGSVIFLKPKEKDAHTNMTVITTTRTYAFDLVTASPEQGGAFFNVVFRYPSEEQRTRDSLLSRTEMALKVAREEQSVLRTQLDNALALANSMRAAEVPVRKNINYWYAGKKGVRPDEVFDDGKFTYFRYKGQREFPAIYLERERGDESLVNTTVKGDTIVVQRLAGRFVLRKGGEVGSLLNASYDAVGEVNETGTISPAVERETKGDEGRQTEILPTQPSSGKVTASTVKPGK